MSAGKHIHLPPEEGTISRTFCRQVYSIASEPKLSSELSEVTCWRCKIRLEKDSRPPRQYKKRRKSAAKL